MVLVTTITDVLNIWNQIGVFSYVIPFLLIFAVVFAILDKSQILGSNKPLMGIVSASIGLLSLQFDFVSEFFAVIFPRFGIGLSVFLTLLIFLGFFYPQGSDKQWKGKVTWIGWFVGIGIVLWAFSSWDQWGYYSGFGGWFSEYIWALIVLGILIGVIIWIAKSGEEGKPRT